MKVTRKSIAAAFRRLARGMKAKQAYAQAVRFYCNAGKEWSRHLGCQ